MTAEEFDKTMRRLKRQEPFQPFVVELFDGHSIAIEWPHLVFDGAGATLWTPQDELVDFRREQVRAIRLATGERVS